MSNQRDWRAKPLPLNAEGWIRLEDAESKARTAFWRGLIIGVVTPGVIALIAEAAWSETIVAWVGM